ncbi:MAG: DUF4347 domain-containing protein, partial [Phycisphaerae bacterium]
MNSSDSSNPDSIAPEARTVMPPRLMRLEERIVLDAAGVADDASDSDSHNDGDYRFADACAGNARDTDHGTVPKHRDATANHPDPGNDSGTLSVAPADRISDLVKSAIERAIRPSVERTEDLATLQGLLGEWHERVTDGIHDAGSAVTQFFGVLSDTLQQTFNNGLLAILGQHPASTAHPAPHVSVDANDAPYPTAVDLGPGPGIDAGSEASSSVLIISSSVDQAGALAAAATDDVISTIFDARDMTPDSLLQQIRDLLGGHNAQTIALATNGLGDGHFELTGGVSVSLDTLQDADMQAFWKGLADMVEPGGRIDLLACDAAAGAQGRELLAAFEDLTGVNFAASTDKTGHTDHGGDWILESDDIVAAIAYFDDHDLAAFTGVLGDNMPTITDTDPGNIAVGGGGAVVVDAGITVDDGDGGLDDLQGAVVRITTGFNAAQDQLLFNSGLATGFGISGSYDATTGELILSGAATAAEYQQVLRTVTYENTSATPDTTAREILFAIGDDFDGYSYYAANGHYYQFVDVSTNWTAADTAADGSTLGGLQGYLGTITSAGENAVVTAIVPGGREPWLGASDAATEGEWFWVNGPEAGTQFWQGDENGAQVGGMYVNWDPGNPDHTAGVSGAQITDTGVWEDLQVVANHRYIIEYGGMGSDAEGTVVAAVTVNVASSNNAPVLDNSGDMSLTAISEDDTANAGTT